jgi:hypothetical protein
MSIMVETDRNIQDNYASITRLIFYSWRKGVE